MPHIGLISCVGAKRPCAAQARDLYTSTWFSKSREFVEQQCDTWFILSAKYGLVKPTDIIEPYEEALSKKPVRQRQEWARRVWAALRPSLNHNDRVTILAGEKYRDHLVPLIEQHGCKIDVPMRGLGIGRQLLSDPHLILTALRA